MWNTVMLIAGIVMLTIVSYDFFFTTLSGTGTSFITRGVSSFVHKASLYSIRIFNRKLMRHFGMLMNLLVLFVWIFLFWIGIFLVFSYDPTSIITKDNHVATAMERLYFSGFVFSTLGIGDIGPNSDLYRILTGIFSFLGFSFFTMSITYLITVFSALTHKRALAQSIRNFGRTPSEVLNNMVEYDPSFTLQHLSQFQNMLNSHIVNHQAYPVLNYYNSENEANSLNLNLVVLDEAITMYLHQPSEKPFAYEVQPLRNALSNFISQIREKHEKEDYDAPKNDWGKLDKTHFTADGANRDNETLIKRRRKLSRVLINEGFTWDDVYPTRKEQPQ
nr:hypothetical protein [Cytophagales bacterium]